MSEEKEDIEKKEVNEEAEKRETEEQGEIEGCTENQRTGAREEQDESTEDEPSKERLEEEVEELEKSLKKVMADFDNYRKRTAKERKKIINQATADLMEDLLEVLDDFERALGSDDDLDHDGVNMIYDKFYKKLKNHGLKEIDAEGKEFDPHYHECVMSEEVDDEEKKDKILEQFEKGYKLNSKVIRPAKVKVGK